MTPFDTVFSMAGHSTAPILALIHSGISTRYIIIFTEELEENMNHFESYLEQKEWGENPPNVKCVSIGSIGDYETTYAQIKDIFDERSSLSVYNKGIFLQNGAKQLILSNCKRHVPYSENLFYKQGCFQTPQVDANNDNTIESNADFVLVTDSKLRDGLAQNASDILNFETENSRSDPDKLGKVKKEDAFD